MINKYMKPYRFPAIIGFLFKIIEAYLELQVPLVVADIIDYGIAKGDVHYIWVHGFMLYGLAIAGYCCALVCQWFASKTSQAFGTDLRNDMYKTINQYDHNNIDQIGTPSLITRMNNDVVQLQLAVAMTIRLCSRGPFLIIGSIIMALRINLEVSCIFLVAAPIFGLIIYAVLHATFPLYVKVQSYLDKVSLVTRENLSGNRVVRAFSKQNYEKKRIHEATNQQKDTQIFVGKIAACLNPMTTVTVNAAIMLILYLGAIKVNVGTLTQGEVVALVNYMNSILLAMIAFSNTVVILIKAGASVRRCREVLDIKPEMVDGTRNEGNEKAPLVNFDHVSFSFKNAKAIEDVSFDIEAGQTIGIIGGTGSGKSTLMRLLLRFYDVTNGQIDIKGYPIQEYELSYLRKMMGVVPQNAVLFKGTIESNLLWGNPKATKEDMEKALRLAQADFVFEYEDGLQHPVIQDGHNFSGGQKQRLTIARALVKNPELLILDDSASALDFATDAKLRKALKKIDTTTIIVSQRVSSLMHADKIIVLSHGQLVGIGNHKELCENCEIYQEIVQSQLEVEA